jgi:ribosomal protein S18 acetylase RimI-like enzyme
MIEIRPLRTDDEAARCATILSTSEPWLTIGRKYDESLALVRDPSREVYVAWNGDQFCGFIILVMHGAFVGYIQIVAVAPDVRGSGVGTELMSFAEQKIFARFPNAFLCVSSHNPRARQLYERLGYELVGELKNYLINGYSEFLMRKTRGPIRPEVDKA